MSSITDPLNERKHTGQHHLHGDTEPLPTSQGGTTTTSHYPHETTGLSKEGIIGTQPEVRHGGTQPTSDTLPNQYEGARHEHVKPKIGDKVVGKTEEVMGKVTGNPQLREKGAERAYRDATI